LVDTKAVLAIYQRRSMWNITSRPSMVNPLSVQSVIKATGSADPELINSLIRFFVLLDAGALGIPVPARPRTACTCNGHAPHRHLEDNALITDFYIKCTVHDDEDVRRVAEAALDACSFQLSSASAERSFAIVSNYQHATTLLGGADYLRWLAMFTANKKHLLNMYRVPMRKLALQLGH
jgi:hypothetical protein